MESYFQGRQSRGTAEHVDDQSGTTVQVSIYARWQDTEMASTACCGASCELSLSRTVGLSRKDSHSLAAGLGGSLGIEAIAQIKSKIETTVGSEITWEESVEHTQKFNLTAPPCGCRTDSIYQFVREYEMSFSKQRLFGGVRSWDRLLVERTRMYFAYPSIDPYDMKCHCPPPPRPSKMGLLDWTIGPVTLRTDYSWTGDNTVVFMDDKLLFLPPDFSRTGATAHEVSAKRLPAYIPFLVGKVSESYRTEVSIVPEELPEAQQAAAERDGAVAVAWAEDDGYHKA